ncbi:MAG: hypothetical protein FJY80_12370 [Candidatus Aminicenantes bacterium]|nr:hypothetical protein [Candidatus Aminicenantes bacterium]
MDFCAAEALKLDYVNGRLSEKDGALFEEHLAVCPACRGEVLELRETAAAMAGLARPPVPPAWTAAVKGRLELKRHAPARRRASLFLYAAISAGVTAAVVLLFWLGPRGTSDRITWFLSLPSLLFVPSIIDNIYRLVRRGVRRTG